MIAVLAGAVLVGAWIVAGALGKFRDELTILRILQEHVAAKHGVDLEDYSDDVGYRLTGVESSRQIQRRIEQEREDAEPL